MTTYAYFINGTESRSQFIQSELSKYMDNNNLTAENIVADPQNVKVQWQKRLVADLIQSKLQSGDNLVVYEAAELARSTSQMLEILLAATHTGFTIHFVKYNNQFEGKETYNLKELLNILTNIESDYIARRTTDALARRRAAGLPLGRPKGRKNKALKLDRHKKDIMKYIDLNISKASIAKLVGCHPQTLYDWLDRQGIKVAKSKRGRGAITGAILEQLELQH